MDGHLRGRLQEVEGGLANATMLVHPVDGAPLALTVDASVVAIGGVLEQHVGGHWQPLGFFSKPLQGKQPEWVPFDRELLAAHRSIRHFRPYLEGRQFTLYSDHNSLVLLSARSLSPHHAPKPSSSRGSQNTRATSGTSKGKLTSSPTPSPEFLSQRSPPPPCRSTVNAVGPQGIDFVALAHDQATDSDTQRLLRDAHTGLRFSTVRVNDVDVICDVSSGRARPLVPETWRRRVFDAVHGQTHPGVKATKKLITSRSSGHQPNLTWPDGPAHAPAVTQQGPSPCASSLQRFETPEKRFQHIHIDLVGPLPPRRVTTISSPSSTGSPAGPRPSPSPTPAPPR